jgi:hypothetical protein
MAKNMSPPAPKNDREVLQRFGIKPGAKLSRDPEPLPETELCNLPGCGKQHYRQSACGGD